MGYKKLVLALALLLVVQVVLAQAPPASQPDERAVTIGIIRNPDANAPDEIIRKISTSHPRQRGEAADGSGADLASPGGKRTEATGSPGTPDPVVPPVPIDPGDPGSPAVPSAPGPSGGPDSPPPPASPEPPTPAPSDGPSPGPESPGEKPPSPPPR